MIAMLVTVWFNVYNDRENSFAYISAQTERLQELTSKLVRIYIVLFICTL